MGEPAEAVFINHVCYGALVGSLFDFFVWNEVTPLNDQNLSEAFFFLVKGVKLLLLAGFQMSGFAAIQKCGEYTSEF